MGSTVVVTAGGVNITNRCLWQGVSFESQQNGMPGTIEITVKDETNNYVAPATGSEITVDVDGVRLFGGYLLQVSRRFAFPAVELPTSARLFVLRGADYNILFDKRITRNPANYLAALPQYAGTSWDGDLIKYLCANYLDIPAGFNTTTYVDNIVQPVPLARSDSSTAYPGAYKQQGSTWREQMDTLQKFSGAVYYIDPTKHLHWHAIENVTAPFGFSDTPNPPTTIGMRDVSAVEDGSGMANHALVWGGSEWTKGVIFAEATNTASVTAHNRWEAAETHFGEEGFMTSTQWRANLLVNGSTAVGALGFDPGLAFPQWSITLTWFGRDVPGSAHLTAGQLVAVSLTSLGGALNPITLPMRSIKVDFAGLDPAGNGEVSFTGSMGLQPGDPYTVWRYLLGTKKVRNSAVAAAADDTTGTAYGSFGQFTPVLVSGTTYRLPNQLGYIVGTTQVYVSGLLIARGVGYTESDPPAGMITFTSAPTGPTWIVCRTT